MDKRMDPEKRMLYVKVSFFLLYYFKKEGES